MEKILSKSLADIVTEDHRTASVLEKYGLDFCCKGKRPLRLACEEKSLNTEEVVNELFNARLSGNSYSTGLNFNELRLDILTTYIVNTHHAYIRKETPHIASFLQKLSVKHTDKYPELRQVAMAFEKLKQELMMHIQKEELILFPRINDLVKGHNNKSYRLNLSYLQSPITLMEHEHEFAGSVMEEIKKLTHNFTPPQYACTTHRLCYAALKTFCTDLHQHVHLENNILFPRAIQLFGQVCMERLN